MRLSGRPCSARCPEIQDKLGLAPADPCASCDLRHAQALASEAEHQSVFLGGPDRPGAAGAGRAARLRCVPSCGRPGAPACCRPRVRGLQHLPEPRDPALGLVQKPGGHLRPRLEVLDGPGRRGLDRAHRIIYDSIVSRPRPATPALIHRASSHAALAKHHPQGEHYEHDPENGDERREEDVPGHLR